MPNIGWTIVKAGVGAISGKAGSKLSNTAWKMLTTKAKPAKNDFNSPIKETIAFTALSAAIGGTVTMLAQRRAAKWMGMDKILGSATEDIKKALEQAEQKNS